MAVRQLPALRGSREGQKMTRATSQMRHFAERLLALEASAQVASATPGAPSVCEKLRPPLATLMGNTGFAALLSRALVLAGVEVPWLLAVRANAGALEGFDEPAAQVGAAQIAEGHVVLVARLLGLLMTFIGEELTLRLVREVWPDLSLDDMNADYRSGA
jgi:hypothetical protein